MGEEKKDPRVGIAGAIGGVSVAIVALFGIFADNQMQYAAWCIAPLAVMGIVLAFARK